MYISIHVKCQPVNYIYRDKTKILYVGPVNMPDYCAYMADADENMNNLRVRDEL